VFFVAFVPQFMSAEAPILPQIAVLEAIFLGLAALNTALWALAAGQPSHEGAEPDARRAVGHVVGQAPEREDRRPPAGGRRWSRW